MYSNQNTIIIGWNKITEKFISIRFSNSDKQLIVDLECNYKKNPNFHYLEENYINEKIDKNIKYIFYFFEKFNQKKLIQIGQICRKNNLNLFIGSNINAISKKHFVDLRNIKNLFNKKRIYRKFLLRIIDITFSFLTIIIFSPIFIIIALLIFLDDGFPILFTQKRVGLNHKEFLMYKFRSMYKNVEKYGTSPSEVNDSRITKIGELIRKTSFDELPQFFNVLKGDMAIVGPRPEMKFIVDNYNSFENLRLDIKPGITGAWQVSPTRNVPIHYNIDYDLYQIMNNSLRYNIKQIIKTVFWATRGF